MNASLDGTIKLTKRENEMLEKLPILAKQIALHRPEATEAAASLGVCCVKVLSALAASQAGQ